MALTPNMLSKYTPQQQHALDQHKKFSAQLEEKQAGIQKRKTDLDVAGRLLTAMDSKVPVQARKFLTVQFAQYVGVDPKSEQFRGVQQVLTSLDPDSLNGLRKTFADSVKEAPPGKALEMIKGVMTGDVPFHEIVKMAQASNYQNFDNQETATSSSAPQRVEQAAPVKDESRLPAEATPKQDSLERTAPEPFQEGSAAIRSFEGQRTTPPASAQASPQLVGALGLDSTVRYRNDDLIKNGYRVPMDEKGQSELARSINTRATGISTTIREAALMTKLFSGRPETLGPVGDFLRGVQSTVSQVQGALKLIRPEVTDESSANGSDELANSVANTLAKTHGLNATAEDAARIKSMVLGLAYRMAIARDIPGNRLTNAIINQHLTQIGQSSSPEQFKAVVTDTVSSIVHEFNETMTRQLGAKGSDIVARHLSNDDIKTMAQSADLLPPSLAGAIRDEAIRRTEGGDEPAIKPSGPTLDEEERTLGELETQDKRSEIEKRQFDRDIALSQEMRAARSEERAQDREDRIAETQAANAGLAREQFEFDKEKFKDAKERRRYETIRDAFMQFGAAIASSSRGAAGLGVSIPGQQGQDSSAFRIDQAPQRQPPRIPGQ